MKSVIKSQEPKRYLLYATHDYCFSILRPIQAEILARGDNVAWFIHGDEITTNYLTSTERQLASIASVIEYNPFVVITPDNTVPHFFPGIKVQVFHGLNAQKRTRRGLDSHFTIRGFFDLYCTQGPSTTSVFEALKEKYKHFCVAETGWPKLDGLLGSDNAIPKVYAENLPVWMQVAGNSEATVERNRPCIILTSTFSRKLTCAPYLLAEVKKLVAMDTMDWMVQFHPKMCPKTVADYKAIVAKNYHFIETSDVMPFLKLADVMVCDTSSILQEFLQLERPVVAFRNRNPGPWLINIQSPDELSYALEQALSPSASLLENIRQYNGELHPFRDGLSSRRVLQAIDDFEQCDRSIIRRKPANPVRRFKMRRELSFWRPW